MPATFVHDGEYLDHIPVADLPAGTVVVLADSVGITVRPIAAGALGSLAMCGVFELARAPGVLIPQGKRVFWDPTVEQVVGDSALGSVVPLGIAAAESVDTALAVRVRLNH